jgi:hypothetical protein
MCHVRSQAAGREGHAAHSERAAACIEGHAAGRDRQVQSCRSYLPAESVADRSTLLMALTSPDQSRRSGAGCLRRRMRASIGSSSSSQSRPISTRRARRSSTSLRRRAPNCTPLAALLRQVRSGHRTRLHERGVGCAGSVGAAAGSPCGMRALCGPYRATRPHGRRLTLTKWRRRPQRRPR